MEQLFIFSIISSLNDKLLTSRVSSILKARYTSPCGENPIFSSSSRYITAGLLLFRLNNNKLLPLQTLPPAKNLSNEDLFKLQNIGLLETENPNIFISPGTDDGITPLWFYRTQYAWFWTPKEPQNYNIEEIKKCNWSLIQSNRPITAIGGRYNNIMPALRNIKLIKTLIKYGMSYLTPDNQ